MYNLADLHCDTPFELYHKNEELKSNSCHISLDKASVFEKYVQVLAVWSNYALSDSEALSDFFNIHSYISSELDKNCLSLSKSGSDIERSLNDSGRAFVLSVEDARIINSSECADKLYSLGVRIVTMLWQSTTVIGGSFDTNEGLSDHGKYIIEHLLKLGIIPDISHASHESAKDIIDIANKHAVPVIASHSNSLSVFDHPRNLSDGLLKEVVKSGGVVGISFAPQHLCSGDCGTSAVLRHVEHYLNAAGDKSICLGGDFDGIGATPVGIEDISKLPSLFDLISAEFGASTAENIFYNNAKSFLIKNIR
jgi:membrane dipeptidase